MAEEKTYCIKIPGTVVEVTEEVYLEYFRMRRRWSAQDERNTYNGVVSYDAMDNCETLGVDSIPDLASPGVEDIVLSNLLQQKLRHCLHKLSTADQALIFALFYEQKTEREYAKLLGISQKAVNKRRHKALDKLRELMEG